MTSEFRYTNSEEVRVWKDHIPLKYKYSIGVAAQKFSSALKEGKLLGFKCSSCSKVYALPLLFCPECFKEIREYVEIKPEGEIYSFTERGEEVVIAVKFPDTYGVLIHKMKKPLAGRPRIGQKVRAVFKKKEERSGEITDILWFELF